MWLLSECGVVEWFAARKVVGTYLLRLKPSINYVWIFRVFLIVMLLTPPLLRLSGPCATTGDSSLCWRPCSACRPC